MHQLAGGRVEKSALGAVDTKVGPPSNPTTIVRGSPVVKKDKRIVGSTMKEETMARMPGILVTTSFKEKFVTG
jgi:hypothetical protein